MEVYKFFFLLLFSMAVNVHNLYSQCTTNQIDFETNTTDWILYANNIGMANNVPPNAVAPMNITGVYWWDSTAAGSWISCLPSGLHPTNGIGPNQSMTYRYEFKSCGTDTLILNMQVFRDNFCKLYLDGNLVYADPIVTPTNQINLNVGTWHTFYLPVSGTSTTTHTLDFEIIEFNINYSLNGWGGKLNGTITSQSGGNTVVYNNPSCTTYVCCPVLALNITGDTTLCTGDSTLLNVSGATTYQWNPTSSLSSSTSSNVWANPITTTTYTVIGTDANGCSSTSSVVISVLPVPILTTSAAPGVVCAGNPVILNATGASTYIWSGGITNGLPFLPSTSGTYTVTGTAVNGCTASTTQNISVNPAPLITGSATPSSICLGQTTTLNGAGGLFYTWSGGVSNGIPFFPSTSSTYTVTGVDANGCSNTSIVNLTVSIPPTVSSIAMPDTVCAGQSTTLVGIGATTYAWSGGVINNVAFIPLSTTTYTVTGTTGGCSSTHVQLVVVNPVPIVTATALPNTLCLGEPAILTGFGANTYNWTGGVTNGVSFVPSSSGTYTVTGTDNNGCTNHSTVNITVSPTPNLVITNSEPDLCIGDTSILTVSGAYSYLWSPSTGLSNTTSNNIWAYPLTTTMYSVIGTDINGCTATANTLVNIIQGINIVLSKSNDIDCNLSTSQLSATGAENYLWSPSTYLSNPTGNVTTAKIPNTTTFYVTGNTGTCVDEDSITVNVFANNDNIFIPNAFTPNKDGLNDCLRVITTRNFYYYEFAIYNRWGQRVFESDNIYDCWNGEFRNQPVEIGTYYYYLKGKTTCNEVNMKGDITVIR